jgi:hypothetical protein
MRIGTSNVDIEIRPPHSPKGDIEAPFKLEGNDSDGDSNLNDIFQRRYTHTYIYICVSMFIYIYTYIYI